MKDQDQLEEKRSQKPLHHSRTSSAPPKDLASFAEEYRKLSIDCLKVLRIEMQLETIFHMQEMTSREYLDDQDAEEPDDFVISLTSQITRRDEEMAPFVAGEKRNYIFGGICSIAANAFMKALAAISSIDNEAIQLRLDRVRTYYELLNMPFEVNLRMPPVPCLFCVSWNIRIFINNNHWIYLFQALLAFIAEHEHLFTSAEYTNLLKVQVPGREIPSDAEDRVAEIFPR
ncbi:Exocyst complex component SEC8 [Forsythia ovata]|uniref:Exocyst complex component Sec8 n=1 Tax=Forsythia ovata TaxID=205694 RepID=A0ABD1X180_9LAMI